LLLIQNRVELINPGSVVRRISSEGNAQHVQELVHSVNQSLRRVGPALEAWLSLVDNNLIGKVGGHDEVVLDNKGSLLIVEDESLEHSGADDSLLAVQVGGRLIDQVGVCSFGKGQNNGNSLQLSS
jgi:hypothetical protein